MTTTSSERHLPAISVVFEVAGTLPRLILPFLALAFATGSDRERRVSFLIFVVGGGLAVATIVVTSFVRWVRFRYRYDETDLVIRSGLFHRNERRIPYARIQNLDAAQNPLHRLFGVSNVLVQTGGGAEPEASMVLASDALREMQARVHAAGGGRAHGMEPRPAAAAATTDVAPAPADAAPRSLLRLPPAELFLAGVIENRGMVLIAGAIALLEQAGASRWLGNRLAEDDGAIFGTIAARLPDAADVPVAYLVVGVTVALLFLLLFIRLLSTVWAMVRLYDFRLERDGDELRTEYGLFTRVSAVIPLRRVQTIIIRDGMLHRMWGRCAVQVETAGGVQAAGARPREPIAPILRLDQLPALLDELQPGLVLDGIEWRPVHRRAFGRMLRAGLLGPTVAAAVAAPVVGRWTVLLFFGLVVLAAVRARLRARHLGWALLGDSVVVRDGALMHEARIARFNRVQVVALDRNPFDLRAGMAGVRADTAGAGSGVVVPYLPEQTAVALHRELSERTAATAFTW